MPSRIDASPFETQELRASLKAFYQTEYHNPSSGKSEAIGSYKWGAYIFYDYDGEPIYVAKPRKRFREELAGI